MTSRDRLNEMLQRSINRRTLMRGSAAALGVGALANLLAACGGGDSATTPTAGSGGTGGQTATGTATSAATGTAASTATAAPPAGEGKKGGLLRAAIIGEPPAFDPTFTTATVTLTTTSHVFETLWAKDQQFSPQPMLVDTAEVEENGKVFVLNLRKEVKFHNGDPLTADDVIASLERYGKLSGRGKTLFKRVDKLEKVDDNTVKITFTGPTGIAPVFLMMPDAIMIPKAIADAAPDKEMGEFIGTGPFKLKERLPDRYISIVRNDDYAKRDEPPNYFAGGKTAYFDEIRFIPVSETAVRGDGLVTDEFDFAESVSTDNYDSLVADPSIEVQITLPYYFYGAHFNKSPESMMSNRDLRMALLTAIDMTPVARAGFGPDQFWRLGPEIAAPETAYYSDAGKQYYDLKDPEKAKELLAAAGYDGKPIRWIATKEYSYNYNMGVVLKDQMEKAGAVIDFQVMDWATLVKQRSQKDAWDIFITGHPSIDHPVLQVFLPDTWPGWWSNPKKDELMTAIIEEPDLDKQKKLVADLQELWWSEASMIKVCEGATLRGYRTRLKGYGNPADWHFWNTWFDE